MIGWRILFAFAVLLGFAALAFFFWMAPGTI